MGGHCRLSLASNTNHQVRWWCLTIKVTVLRTSEDIKMNRFNFSGWLTVQNVSDKWRGDTKRPAGAGWWLLATSSDPEHLLNVFPQPINQSRVSYTFISATTNHFTGNCREYLACKVYSRIVSWVYLVYHWCCCCIISGVSQCVQWLPPKMFSLLSPCYLSTDLRSKISNNSLSWCLL